MFGRSKPFGKKHSDTVPPAGGARTAPPDFANARSVGNGVFAVGKGGSDAGAPFHAISDLVVGASKSNGVFHADTALSAVGAIAGFSAQQAICEGPVRAGQLTAADAFVTVGTKDGQTFFMGDFLATIIASTEQGHLSIWRMVAGTALSCGATSLPDITPLFARSVGAMGSDDFGRPSWSGAGNLLEQPRAALRHWPKIRSILTTAGVPALHWPLEISRAAQSLIVASQSIVPPEKALLIVMESAISMSKVDPRSVPGAIAVSA